MAAAAGVDMLAVQAGDAGGHSGTFTPDRTPAHIAHRRTDRTGDAPPCPCPSSPPADWPPPRAWPTSSAPAPRPRRWAPCCCAPTRAAPRPPIRPRSPIRLEPRPSITRAFTGRPARGLRNGFIDTYESLAPLGYPAIHHLTSPLRKAAAAAGEPDLVHLWAGTGYRHARTGADGRDPVRPRRRTDAQVTVRLTRT